MQSRSTGYLNQGNPRHKRLTAEVSKLFYGFVKFSSDKPDI